MCNFIKSQDIRAGLVYALENLEKEKNSLNALNLFPVADKDTGTNLVHSMSLTVKNLQIGQSVSQTLMDVSELLLKYAYGSSGTILNMFFEGFAYAASELDTLKGRDLAKAYASGVDCAISAVDKPEDGTMLSVGRQSAHAGLSIIEITDHIPTVWERITQEAHAALQLTPLRNPKLLGTGVIDSGAYGFCLILDGFLKSFAPDVPAIEYPKPVFPGAIPCDRMVSDDIYCDNSDLCNNKTLQLLYRYCTEFVAKINHREIMEDVKSAISGLGNCFLCVSNENLIKIHIHTNQPKKILELGERIGNITSRKVDDMKSGIKVI